MRLYAVTYTDPHEPWGNAVFEAKLYTRPSQALDALNAQFDEYCAQWRGQSQRDPSFVRADGYVMSTDWTHSDWAANYADLHDHPYYALAVMAREFSKIYGIGRYEVLGLPPDTAT